MSKEAQERSGGIRRRDFLLRVSGAAWSLAVTRRKASGLVAPVPPDPHNDQNDDPTAYARYVRTSRDFRRVRQERAMTDQAFPGWIYMPWTYQWGIGYTDASGKWSREHGYNGAFLDGNGFAPDDPPGKLAWINRYALRFYVDHTAGKGSLHLWDGDKKQAHLAELHGTGIRPVPLNDSLKKKLRENIRLNVTQVKLSPYRAAYALDDEVSWGHFTHPTMWRVTDDASAYPAWLREVYGPANIPARPDWITYDALRPHLETWAVQDFDASPLMDQWSFNDSTWCNLLGDLVEYANTVDPATPCGIVGGQAPSAFGGYDYAKLMRKIQYIEAYNLGGSQALIRSFDTHHAVPAVTSMFHQSANDDIWQAWHGVAHGLRGHIGWVENWFDGQTPRPWQDQVAPHYREIEDKIAAQMQGAVWQHDGIALYYNHASVQLGWILDAQAHGKTWTNRDGDHRLGASHLVRQAWENMLRDSGLQYNHLSYVDVIQDGIPAEYRTLILPACLCLSDAEARIIQAFCRAGGTVIADYLPGVWDQHGRGRKTGGVLDAMFGVRHDSAMTIKDVWGGRLWAETDQDANYSWKTYAQLLTNQSGCIKDASGFHKAVRNMPTLNKNAFGKGTAYLMNLSPQWYNAYRVAGQKEALRRDTFLRPLAASRQTRQFQIETPDKNGGANGSEDVFGYEITTWRKPDGRTLLFVCHNPETVGTEQGGGNAARLPTGAVDITLRFARPVRNIRDERRSSKPGDGDHVGLTWTRNEAVVVSFDSP